MLKLDILAIGAHPDDVELSCGGTMIKMVKHGRKVGVVDLTAGEMSTRGTPGIRAEEAREAAEIMGAEMRECLQIPDGNIENNAENRIKLIRAIRHYRPDILLFPMKPDRHPDHEHAYTLCKEAWFYAGLEKIVTERDGIQQAPFRPRTYYHYMQWFEFAPSFIVDVSAEFPRRMEIVKAYHSQFYNPDSTERETILTSPEFLEMIQTRAAYYGDRIGVQYGEPFYSASPLRVDDIVALNA